MPQVYIYVVCFHKAMKTKTILQ